jgi:hypothetical protein
LTCHLDLSRLFCPGWSVPVVMSQVPCPDCTLIFPAAVFRSQLSCPSCPVFGLLFCPDLPVLFRLVYPGLLVMSTCPPVRAFLPQLSCPSCPVQTVLSFSCHCCLLLVGHVLAARFSLFFSDFRKTTALLPTCTYSSKWRTKKWCTVHLKCLDVDTSHRTHSVQLLENISFKSTVSPVFFYHLRY